MTDLLHTPPPPEPPLLVDSREACRLLCICPRKLWQLSADGKLRAVKIGRMVRYSRQDLMDFINAQRQTAPAQA